ncbi:DUF397 domain-containing protein [Saccharopolyspora cebuensis]|uniref:DUF397 domain-containing protein n=1 Tax=Saccharopolyspora cebuensis TaxID=418759 RepID=UPI0031E84BFC
MEPESWRTSTRTTGSQTCIEVGRLGDGAAVRDTKNRVGGQLTTTAAQWSRFIIAVKNGHFDGEAP